MCKCNHELTEFRQQIRLKQKIGSLKNLLNAIMTKIEIGTGPYIILATKDENINWSHI